MNITYGRISTSAQNTKRQTTEGYKSFVDTCTGSMPFFERPQAKKLISFLKSNPEAITNVLSVDRLGRNTIDVIQTIEYFKANNLTIKIENIGMDNNSPFFEMLVSIMGALAQLEKTTISERCRKGIELAQREGKYTGRKKGTLDNREKSLKKHHDIVMCLNNKMKISDIASITKKTRATVYKVKELI